jgi:predicted Holliday junction resolvase-like endonuclease
MTLKILILAFIIGIVYRVLVRFVLPVVQLTKMTSAKLREMEHRMNNNQPVDRVTQTRSKPKDADYIDYEEVK